MYWLLDSPSSSPEILPSSTIPYTLFLFHFFVHLFLTRVEGYIIWEIAESLSPWPVRRRTVRGIVFRQFFNFRDSAEYGVARDGLSELFFLLMEPDKKFPICLSSQRT